MSDRVFLDYNATTPLHPRLVKYAQDHLGLFGNPSSVHWAGRQAKKVMTETREILGTHWGCQASELIFTGSGTEANNLALRGVVQKLPANKRKILTTKIEHPSVLKTIESLVEEGIVVMETIPVDSQGRVDMESFRSQLTSDVGLVSVQMVNNETGNILPIKEMARVCHEYGVLFHSDMVQALGKIPFDLKDLDVDLASFSGHKFYSLKGAGVLFAKNSVSLAPQLTGGGQERGRRGGTENALAIGCLGEAVRLLSDEASTRQKHMAKLRDHLENLLLELVPGVTVNGAEGERAPNTLNVTVDGVDGESLLINLDTRGFAISSGAACSSGTQEPSPVLRAMGLSRAQASQSMRVSLGWLTTEEEVTLFFHQFKKAVEQIRSISMTSVWDQEVVL